MRHIPTYCLITIRRTLGNLIKLGRSLGNVPQKLKKKKLVIKTCTLENGLTVRNISSFYNEYFFSFLHSDSPNFIKLLRICSIKCHHQHPYLEP
jgi:hypothetical protein